MGRIACLIAMGLAAHAATTAVAEADERPDNGRRALSLRQQYNETSAAIDTIVRVFGSRRLERLADPSRTEIQLPADTRLVLLFWADDEAELFLNGNPISRTRLTPTRVEIPAVYLDDDNELTAHCWDTDRVESGFMCGLYVQDASGVLRPVITTGEEQWSTPGETPAQEIFYAHPQPDIPGARVIWGERLFGKVTLRARFSAAAVQAAIGAPRLSEPRSAKWSEAPMEFHRAVSRLAMLQEKRRELQRALAATAIPGDLNIRYGGRPVSSPLAYTLGRVGPLTSETEIEIPEKIQQWARALPPQQRQLILREARHLKGWSAATAAGEAVETASGEEDRRADYRPPAERGRGAGESSRQAIRGTVRSRSRAVSVAEWLGLVAILAYATGAGFQWWRVFSGDGGGWRRAEA